MGQHHRHSRTQKRPSVGCCTRDCRGSCEEAYQQIVQAPVKGKNSERPSLIRCPFVSGSRQLCHHQCIQTTGGKANGCSPQSCLRLPPSVAASAVHFVNFFPWEVEEHNTHHRAAPVIDPSEELIGVTSVFCVGTGCFARLHRERLPPKSIFCVPSLIGKYLLLSLFILFILFALYILYQLLT